MLPKDLAGDDRSQKAIKIYLIWRDTKMLPKFLTGDIRSQKAIMIYQIPPPPLGSSPIQGIPNYSDSRFNSQPNITGSGFIDESPWRGLGTRLQSEIRGGQDERVGEIKNQFKLLKADIADWNSSALNGIHTLDEIIKKHIALCITISELSNNALITGLDLAKQ